ncbi:MCE family protein [Gordonia sp. TBRC 11910]|uniref:MCE family protein n=1 Tax=Gordonia asplenii TaxID=2725283 RepID=A0A848L3Z1_9ACTN|nr:MCE family protein [Gordonia asplenii]NMO05267.1 MCE family protein [Gordonia asplenii]
MTKPSRIASICAILCAALIACSACRFDGPNSLPLPGNAVSGDGYTVHVQLADSQNLVANSLVRSDNVIIGVVRAITVDKGHADVEVELEKSARVPRDVTAKLAQTSVLGAQYLELVPPTATPTDGASLGDGDVISLSKTSQYPSTESVLAALSLVLNGSGLEQLRTIIAQLNIGFDGHTAEANQAIGRLRTFASGLAAQKSDIQRALDSLARLSITLAAQNTQLADGIDQITPAVKVLADQRADLTRMLQQVGDFGAQFAGVIKASKDNLATTIGELNPTLAQLEKSKSDLTGSLLVALSFPWPVNVIDRGLRGDYQNLFLTLDLSVGAIRDKVIGSLPIGDVTKMTLARQAVDPLRAPLAPAATAPKKRGTR